MCSVYANSSVRRILAYAHRPRQYARASATIASRRERCNARPLTPVVKIAELPLHCSCYGCKYQYRRRLRRQEHSVLDYWPRARGPSRRIHPERPATRFLPIIIRIEMFFCLLTVFAGLGQILLNTMAFFNVSSCRQVIAI